MTVNDLDLNKSYTYADYLTWQFEESIELIEGKIFKMSPAPMRAHQQVIRNIFTPLSNFIGNHSYTLYSALFDVRLTKTTTDHRQIDRWCSRISALSVILRSWTITDALVPRI